MLKNYLPKKSLSLVNGGAGCAAGTIWDDRANKGAGGCVADPNYHHPAVKPIDKKLAKPPTVSTVKGTSFEKPKMEN